MEGILIHELEFNIFEQDKPENMFVRSSSQQLNNFLQGGLHRGMVTQLYGQSGCGKSQIAMLFALGAISNNLPVCFLSTEKQMSWTRFTSLAYTFMNQAQYEQKQKLMMYKKCSDFNLGYIFMEESMKKIKENGKGGLLVIDSIHTLIMSCIESLNIDNDAYQKSRKQAQIVNRIRWLGKMAGCGILLINHAADLMDKRRSSEGRTVVPSLGPSWQLNMDESIYLSRKGEVRQITAISSPKCSYLKKQHFRIQKEGLVWISQQGVEYK